MTVHDNIFRRLARKELITPYLESAMIADNWPDKYTIEVDSSPYYGTGDGYFHPSSHAISGAYNNASERYLYYLFHPEHRRHLVWERRTSQSQITLAVGSALHAVVQTQMQMAGLIASPEDIEVEYINHEHHLRGRNDFIVTHPNGGRIPVELKTQNVFAFDKQKTVKPEWEAQLNLALDNLGYEFGVLLVLQSGWPFQFKEFRVSRNDELLSEIYQKFDDVREAVELDRPPKACCMVDSSRMQSCPARYVCWLSDDPSMRPGEGSSYA